MRSSGQSRLVREWGSATKGECGGEGFGDGGGWSGDRDRQAEADVGGAGVGALGLPGRRPVTAAVGLGAEERAPFDHMLGQG